MWPILSRGLWTQLLQTSLSILSWGPGGDDVRVRMLLVSLCGGEEEGGWASVACASQLSYFIFSMNHLTRRPCFVLHQCPPDSLVHCPHLLPSSFLSLLFFPLPILACPRQGLHQHSVSRTASEAPSETWGGVCVLPWSAGWETMAKFSSGGRGKTRVVRPGQITPGGMTFRLPVGQTRLLPLSCSRSCFLH